MSALSVSGASARTRRGAEGQSGAAGAASAILNHESGVVGQGIYRGRGLKERDGAIIDELDRCRPNFALGIIETLKHFFRSDGVHFVLVTNVDHLKLSVQKEYGVGEAAQEYLQKFYDFMIHFEAKRPEHRAPNSAVLVHRLIQELIPAHVQPMERQEISGLLERISIAFDLTLRQAEAVVTNVTLAYLAVREREFRPYVQICFLALLKALKPDLYQQVKIGRFPNEEFRRFLATGRWPEGFNIERIRIVFRYYGDPMVDPRSAEFQHFGSGLHQYGFDDRLDVLPYLANAVMDRFGKL